MTTLAARRRWRQAEYSSFSIHDGERVVGSVVTFTDITPGPETGRIRES